MAHPIASMSILNLQFMRVAYHDGQALIAIRVVTVTLVKSVGNVHKRDNRTAERCARPGARTSQETTPMSATIAPEANELSCRPGSEARYRSQHVRQRDTIRACRASRAVFQRIHARHTTMISLIMN